MRQPELLKARCVDDAASPVVVLGVIPAGGRGRLLAQVEGDGEFARCGFGVRNEKIENGRLSHARLAHKKRSTSFQSFNEARSRSFGFALGGDRDDVVADGF